MTCGKLNHRFLWACGWLALLGPLTTIHQPPSTAWAAERKKESLADKEQKQSDKEEELERKGSEIDQIQAVTRFVGTVTMGTDGLEQPGPGVVGSIRTTDGQLLQLKLAEQALLKKLSTFDNRKVSLTGKTRNEGKYLVVSEVSEIVAPAGGAPPTMRKRGGI